MTDTTTDTPELQLRCEPAGKQHRVTVTYGADVIHADQLNLSAATAREKFIRAVCERCAALDPAAVEQELLKLLAGGGPAPPPADALAEVDVSRVVRPELFHHPAVSGLTVAVVLAAGEKLVPRWRTHLRWADGRREVIDLPTRIDLPDDTTLYIHPDPGEPLGADPPAWSAGSRRKWVNGRDAPDPAAVFKRLCQRIAHYLDFPADAAAGTTATLALWSLLTYLYPAWPAVPYLSVGGPMGSGKSRALDVLQRLAFRPLSSSNMTAPALFRTLNAAGGTLLYDEAERLRQSTPDVQELQSMLLAGYRRGGAAVRLEPVGDGFRPVRFEVFGPKALACIAGLPPTLASRSIAVPMLRAAADSPKPGRLLDADPAGWQSLRDDLHVLSLEYGPLWCGLASDRTVLPPGVAGRDAELWQPLLTLAGWLDGCGAAGLLDLMKRHAVRSVAAAKSDGIPEADETLLELLAEAVRLGRQPTTGELLQDARDRDDAAFKLWHARTVAYRLKTYGIPPPAKVNGERRYRSVTCEQMTLIQQRYGLELGMA